MRELKTHIVEGDSANHQLKIEAMDEPWNESEVNSVYQISGMLIHGGAYILSFQKGPIKEVGVNGITNEALLAILIDRMEGFQKGKFKCVDNQIALEHMKVALEALQDRTRERMLRGVEGTHEK